jgi:nucleoside-diphosphate-sugar epimerase
MNRALVTGATGLLGYHILRRLREAGWRVRALARSVERARHLEQRGATVLQGDLLDTESVKRAASGTDVVFHSAAVIATRGGWETFMRANVVGTRNTLAAAQAAGARLVHVSSVAVYGSETMHPRDGGLVSEDAAFSPLSDREYYARSKREAEQMVMDACARGQVWACALRPDVMYGIHDRQFVPRAARALMSPIVPLVGDGQAVLRVVYAGNVADAALLAATSDTALARVYNVTNDYDVRYLEFMRLACAGLRRQPRMVRIPEPAARAAMSVLEKAALRFMSARVPIPARRSLDFLTMDNPYSSARARNELGWTPRHKPEVKVPEAFSWWLTTRGR